MSVPRTMLASVLTAPQQISLANRDVPVPGPSQVLARVTAVGVCGSDTHFYETGRIGDIVVEGPIVLGHETAGEIVAVGPGGDASRIGERIAIDPQRPCRRCTYCKHGQSHLCVDMKMYGAYPHDGSFAEYVLVEDDFAYAVPDTMSDEQAALVEPLSVAVHACRRAGVTAGSRVFITGAGPIGVMCAQAARAFGATEVVVSDPNPLRRDYIAQHGADEVIDPANTDLGRFDEHFDIYLDASGNTRAVQSAFSVIRRGGTAVLVGMGGLDYEVPIAMLQHREITLTGTFRYVNTWPTAIELIASGHVDVSGMVTGRYGLENTADALMKAKTDPTAIKTMIIPARTQRQDTQ
jgi:L-iditol 2-dehydrogenase